MTTLPAASITRRCWSSCSRATTSSTIPLSSSPPWRYRPYLRALAGGYEVYYTISFEERRRLVRGPMRVFANHLLNRSYLANLLCGLVADPLVSLPDPERAPYDDCLPEDLDRLLYSYDRLLDRAGERPVHLFTIPHHKDYERGQLQSGEMRLPQALRAFADSRPRLQYTDLLPAFEERASSGTGGFGGFFLPCYGHWNNPGHAVAAKAVLEALEPTVDAIRRD